MSGSSQAVLPARHLLHAGYVLGVVALLAGCEVLGAPSSLVGGSLVDGVHLDVALSLSPSLTVYFQVTSRTFSALVLLRSSFSPSS